MKCNQPRPGFEFVSPCSFPTTITISLFGCHSRIYTYAWLFPLVFPFKAASETEQFTQPCSFWTRGQVLRKREDLADWGHILGGVKSFVIFKPRGAQFGNSGCFCKDIKMTNHTELWDAGLAWYSPTATHRICRHVLEFNLEIHAFWSIWPYPIVKIVATKVKFLEPSD